MQATIIALWRKGQRPRFKEGRPAAKPVVASSKVDVHGTTCIHTNFKGEVCGEPVSLDRPHGWLCVHHDLVINERAAQSVAA